MNEVVEMGKILSNEQIGPAIYSMTVYSPKIAKAATPGQFVHVRVADTTAPLLRRPISLAGADANTGEILLIYRVVGAGTKVMAERKVGEEIDCLGPIGTSFTIEEGKTLLIGGGVGIAPMVYLANALNPEQTTVLIGGRNEAELFWKDLFYGPTMVLTSDDGSIGHKGFTVDVMPTLLEKETFSRIYICGPTIMMKKAAKIAQEYGVPCEVSLEEYMGCGTGGCLGCSIDGRDGKRYKVCHDGPVFPGEEVFFDA